MTSQEIDQAWQLGRDAWPGVSVERDEFADYLTRLSSTAEPSVVQGGAVRKWGDLYLACACARGDEAALRAFERAFFSEVEVAAARAGRDAMTGDELKQLLRHKLFVADAGAAPRITEYSGRGDLKGWVRIVAMREALNAAKRKKREVAIEPADLTGILGASTDPEIEYVRKVYGDELRAAFAQAFGELEDRERALLRYALADGLTVDAIGALFSVHRATAARWVSKAHEHLVRAVKRALSERLGAAHKDYASVLRALASQLHVTLDRYLAAAKE
jgi:RNA polymerase sigma-70 factor (ECF subfamily)